MFVSTLKKRLLFNFIIITIIFLIKTICFHQIFISQNIFIDFAINPFNICTAYPALWHFIKVSYVFLSIFSAFVFSNFLYSLIFISNISTKKAQNTKIITYDNSDLNILIGNNSLDSPVFLPEKGLYQNILITGTIGSGKTSSAMYPFTEQLIRFKFNNKKEKLGLLVLDVKGNYHIQVKKYCEKYNRTSDIMVLSLDGTNKYNPLDKP